MTDIKILGLGKLEKESKHKNSGCLVALSLFYNHFIARWVDTVGPQTYSATQPLD